MRYEIEYLPQHRPIGHVLCHLFRFGQQRDGSIQQSLFVLFLLLLGLLLSPPAVLKQRQIALDERHQSIDDGITWGSLNYGWHGRAQNTSGQNMIVH